MNKKLRDAILELKKNCAAQDPYLVVKSVLLKLMNDRGCYFDVAKELPLIMCSFTFNTIISIWSGRLTEIFGEEDFFIELPDREAIQDFVLNEDLDISGESETILGEVYQSSLSIKDRKESGVTYTPDDIREYMTDMLRKEVKFADRLIDPACGCGWFLISFYHAVMNKYYASGSQIPIRVIHERILKHNIHGIDINAVSCLISKLSLALLYPDFILCENICCADALTQSNDLLEKNSFDWVVTNPPYLGHKKINSPYKKKLRALYKEVFYNKADLSYCFFRLAGDLLKSGGNMVIVTSRYFAESQYAKGLRSYLLREFSFMNVVDFYGVRPFASTGVDPLILYAIKQYFPGNIFEVIKPVNETFSLCDKTPGTYKSYGIKQDELDSEGFLFTSEAQDELTGIIDRKCPRVLSDYMVSFQGIITGFDKAFVVSGSSAENTAAIKECGVKWIKGKDLGEEIVFSGKYLLYADDETDPVGIPHTLKRLKFYRPILEKRREVKRGTRKWYALQWSRKRELFEREKIVFPYKRNKNKFIYDDQAYFFSADIYSMIPKDIFAGAIDLRKLAMLLSSDVYDAYFKTFAKKLGGELYEYYPNTVMKMKIPDIDVINSFSKESDIRSYFNVNVDV